MKSIRLFAGALVLAGMVCAVPARADETLAEVAKQVNRKMVKIFGAGGYKGLAHYGTGFVVSPNGYVLTVYSPILETSDLRVHMSDGTRYKAKVVAIETELDMALLKVGTDKDFVDDPLPYFDVLDAAKRPLAEAGDGVLGFSNEFEIATRDEPMSIMQGRVAAYAKFFGKSGINNAAYTGNVYVIDAITNNPGAGGGVVTTRRGELLGIIGKELRNELTDTWINYAVPIGAKVKVSVIDETDPKKEKTKERIVSAVDLVTEKGDYKPSIKRDRFEGGGYLGITFVPKVVDRTPPYIEEVDQNSPAGRANLKPDDLVVYLNGQPVVSVQAFEELLDRYRPGETVKLEVRRGDKLTTVELKIEEPKKKPVRVKDENP
jgi:S1-C subfamily serine protease